MLYEMSGLTLKIRLKNYIRIINLRYSKSFIIVKFLNKTLLVNNLFDNQLIFKIHFM